MNQIQFYYTEALHKIIIQIMSFQYWFNNSVKFIKL